MKMKILILFGTLMLSVGAFANGMGSSTPDPEQTLETIIVTVEPITNTADVSNDSTARATNTLVSDGSDFSLDFNQPTDYLSLALPGASSDYGSTAPCLESRRGWIFAGFGASGRTKSNEDCLMDQTLKRLHYQCMQITDRYVALGLEHLAIGQLASCGGITEWPIAMP